MSTENAENAELAAGKTAKNDDAYNGDSGRLTPRALRKGYIRSNMYTRTRTYIHIRFVERGCGGRGSGSRIGGWLGRVWCVVRGGRGGGGS